MMSKQINDRHLTFLQAIKAANEEGYTVEFSTNEKGFYNPENDYTYLPESIHSFKVVRVDAPMSRPEDENILYLLQTIDGVKGWISDVYGLYGSDSLSHHLNRVTENFNCVT